jgi:REP element-mobilizing transposase RayT
MQKLEFERYYHIYNRGINSCNLFNETGNYEHFLRLYEKYILPIADTFAYCLMPNHFHFLVKIKEEKEVFNNENLSGYKRPDRFNIPNRPSKQFSNLFNAYTKSFNKRYNRTGSLFQRPFKRILVENESYLKYLLYYIHYNPVKHGFVEDMIEYPWSSYLTVSSPKKTNLQRHQVINWFDDLDNLKSFHQQEQNLDKIKDLI